MANELGDLGDDASGLDELAGTLIATGREWRNYVVRDLDDGTADLAALVDELRRLAESVTNMADYLAERVTA